MRQAIETKFLGPTKTRGSRVKATADAGSVTIGWDYSIDVVDNHRLAAEQLMKKLEWTGNLIGGGTRSGYVWVIQ